jgi:hypothetical protein
LPVLDAGKEITEFTVSFQLRFDKGNSAVAPGEGFAMNFGALPTNNGRGEEGYAMTNGLTVGWDTADAVDGPYVRLKVGDTNVRTVLASALNPLGTSINGVPNFFFDGAFHPVVIKWSIFDGVEVSYAGQVLMTGIPTPGFSPVVGHRFGFTARTSATLSEGVFVDDVRISTVPSAPLETGGPIISEFMADNEDTREDEDCDSGAWVEIYNGQSGAASLAGWSLTDDPAVPRKWALPSITLPAYAYTVVWADGKNRSVAPNYHANFALQKAGGHLALIKPDGTTEASRYAYGRQAADCFLVLRRSRSRFPLRRAP